jgi:hypothetical protein
MSELTPRVFTILSVLNDLKDAFLTLLVKSNKHPALLMIYSFIDICAALARKDGPRTNKRVFTEYLEEFLTAGTRRTLPPAQLWAARSALLHTFSPLDDHTGPGKSKPIFYYSWTEKKDEVRRDLKERGYSDFTLLSVNEIKGIAIWAFNGMMMRVERDEEFRNRVVGNAEHLLLDYNATRVEAFLRHTENFPKTPSLLTGKETSDEP